MKNSQNTSSNPRITFDLTTSLMDFRTAYLRYIVEIWEELDQIVAYIEKLPSGGKKQKLPKYLKEAPQSSQKLLEKIYQAKDYGCLENDFAPILKTGSAPADKIENAFHEIWLAFHGNLLQNPRFISIAGGVIPWRTEVRLVFNTNSVTDESYGPLFTLGLGWFGTEYDGFLTKIPCPPPEPVAMSHALTQYYQVFPTMFGIPTTELPITEPTGRPDRNDKKVNKRFKDLAGSVDGGGNSCESLGIGGAESFLVYGSLVIQVISLAWTDPNFRNQLLNPNNPNVAPLLGGYFKFHNPWNFNLRFALDQSSPDYSANNQEKAWGKYVKSIKNEIELNFPHPPSNTRLWPAAITSYNATGPAYPFSCI